MPSPAPELVTDAVLAVAVLSRSLERILTELTLPQYRLLSLIDEVPQRAGQIAERSSISRASASSIVKVLERRGLVVRTPAAGDGRGVVLALTAAGETALAEARDLLNARLLAFLSRFDDERRDSVLHALGTITASTGGPVSVNPKPAPEGS